MRKRLALALAALLISAGVVAAAGREIITLNGQTAEVVAESPNRLRIHVGDHAWSYERTGSGTALAGPQDASGAEAQFVNDVVDQWLRRHPEWSRSGRSGDGFKRFIGLVALAVGIGGAIRPRWAWYLSDGWKFRAAEPSDAALVMAQVGGGVTAIVGLVLLLT